MQLPEPRTAAGAAGLAALLAEPARALVALDFDGTLAPIVPSPQDARPADGALAALGLLARLVGTVAIVTGRPVADALALSGVAGQEHLGRLVVLGHYGLERWDAATGELSSPPPLPGVGTARGQLPGLLATAGAPDRTFIEDKRHSIAVHTRRAADPDAALARLRPPLAELAAQTGLELALGRQVAELRPPDTDKGRALTALVRECRAGSVLFAGDDLGDLPAYDAVEALRTEGVPGVTVCSSSAEAAKVAERADLVVDGPAGIVALLQALGAALGSG